MFLFFLFLFLVEVEVLASCQFESDNSSVNCCYGSEPQTCGDFRCVDYRETTVFSGVNQIDPAIYNGTLVFFANNINTFHISQGDLTLPDINDGTIATWKQCRQLILSRPCLVLRNFSVTANSCSGCLWRISASTAEEAKFFAYTEDLVVCLTLPLVSLKSSRNTASAMTTAAVTPTQQESTTRAASLQTLVMTMQQTDQRASSSNKPSADGTTTIIIIVVVVAALLVLVGIGIVVLLYKKGNDLKKLRLESSSNGDTPTRHMNDLSPEFESARGPPAKQEELAAQLSKQQVSEPVLTTYSNAPSNVVYDVVPSTFQAEVRIKCLFRCSSRSITT